MPDQTPTTAQVRHKYATVLDDTQGWRYSEEWGADFDRWLAEHVAAALRAEREAADEAHGEAVNELLADNERTLASAQEQADRAEKAEAAIGRAMQTYRQHSTSGISAWCLCIACDMARALGYDEQAVTDV